MVGCFSVKNIFVKLMQKTITIRKLSDKTYQEDRAYWMSKSPQERIKALEEICEEYNTWRYTNAERRLQRTVQIVKQA
jgi:hypothetical protein